MLHQKSELARVIRQRKGIQNTCVYQLALLLISVVFFIRPSLGIPTQELPLNDWDDFFNDGKIANDSIYVESSEFTKNEAYKVMSQREEIQMKSEGLFSGIGSDVPQTETIENISELVSDIPETETDDYFSPIISELPSESLFDNHTISPSQFETGQTEYITESVTRAADSVHVMFRIGESKLHFDKDSFVSVIVTHLNIKSSQFQVNSIQETDTPEEIDVHCVVFSHDSLSAAQLSERIEVAVREGHPDLSTLKIIYYVTHEGDVIYYGFEQKSQTPLRITNSVRPSSSLTDPRVHTIEMILLSHVSLFDEFKFVSVVSSVSQINAGQISVKNVSDFLEKQVLDKNRNANSKTSVVYDVLHGEMSSTQASKAIMDTVLQGHKGYAEIRLLMARMNDGDFIDFASSTGDSPSEKSEGSPLLLILVVVGIVCGLGLIIGIGFYAHKNKSILQYFVFRWRSTKHAELDEDEEEPQETQRDDEQGEDEPKRYGKNIEMVDLLKAGY